MLDLDYVFGKYLAGKTPAAVTAHVVPELAHVPVHTTPSTFNTAPVKGLSALTKAVTLAVVVVNQVVSTLEILVESTAVNDIAVPHALAVVVE
mgnify:CR=1 FL=1